MLSKTATSLDKPAPLPSERRVTGIALRYWYGLRGARDCPARYQLAHAPRPELAPHLFILTPDDRADDYRVSTAGEELAKLCRSDPAGRAIGDSLPRLLRERAQAVIGTAFKIRKPLADCGWLHETRETDMLYRSVYMPLADSEGRFESLLGAISFKRQAAEAV
jgi:hypothetical protein